MSVPVDLNEALDRWPTAKRGICVSYTSWGNLIRSAVNSFPTHAHLGLHRYKTLFGEKAKCLILTASVVKLPSSPMCVNWLIPYIKICYPGNKKNRWAHVLFALASSSRPGPGPADHKCWSNRGWVWYDSCTEELRILSTSEPLMWNGLLKAAIATALNSLDCVFSQQKKRRKNNCP